MKEPFEAGKRWEGVKCYLCNKPIKPKDFVQFYGGPFLIHADCIQEAVERR